MQAVRRMAEIAVVRPYSGWEDKRTAIFRSERLQCKHKKGKIAIMQNLFGCSKLYDEKLRQVRHFQLHPELLLQDVC